VSTVTRRKQRKHYGKDKVPSSINIVEVEDIDRSPDSDSRLREQSIQSSTNYPPAMKNLSGKKRKRRHKCLTRRKYSKSNGRNKVPSLINTVDVEDIDRSPYSDTRLREQSIQLGTVKPEDLMSTSSTSQPVRIVSINPLDLRDPMKRATDVLSDRIDRLISVNATINAAMVDASLPKLKPQKHCESKKAISLSTSSQALDTDGHATKFNPLDPRVPVTPEIISDHIARVISANTAILDQPYLTDATLAKYVSSNRRKINSAASTRDINELGTIRVIVPQKDDDQTCADHSYSRERENVPLATTNVNDVDLSCVKCIDLNGVKHIITVVNKSRNTELHHIMPVMDSIELECEEIIDRKLECGIPNTAVTNDDIENDCIENDCIENDRIDEDQIDEDQMDEDQMDEDRNVRQILRTEDGGTIHLYY